MHTFFTQRRHSGYIALTSVIICSLLLLAVTAVIGMSSYFGRFAIVKEEFKQQSNALAEACVDYALAQLKINPTAYSGNETAIPVGSNTCQVGSITPGGNEWPKIIQAQGAYPQQTDERSFTTLLVTVDSNFNIISWEEVAE